MPPGCGKCSGRRRGPAALAVVLAGSLAAATPARGYDPATTHAGLTERAALASSLHKILSRRLNRPLGVFEPLALDPTRLTPDRRRLLLDRLGRLDPAGGYRPGDDGVATALAWVVAGSVIAKTPPERGRHHFFEPGTGKGLHGQGGAAGFLQSLRTMLDGGSLRALATGTAFDLTGRPAVEWMAAADNDLGLPALHDHLDRAASAAAPEERASALAQALLALGGLLAVLQDAGEPAHVRNDFREAFLGSAGRGVFDRASAYERFVAARFGRSGVPAPSAPVSRPTLRAFVTASDGEGLADRTHRRFITEGTLPEDGVVDRDTTPAEVMRAARESLAYPRPRLPRLELREIGRKRYAVVDGRRLLAYRRVPGRVRFMLDNAVFADTALALLPEIGAYSAGLIDHVLRGELVLTAAAGGVEVTAGFRALRGKVRILAEDESGRRREIGGAELGAAAAPEVVLATVAVPADARRVVAVLRGEDDAGPVLASAELVWSAAGQPAR